MTDTLEKAIAPEASTGLNNILNAGYKTPIATGIRITLYANAQNKFNLIVFKVLFDKLIAETIELRFLLTKVMPDASIATSVPLPMAIPISAAARAGASFIPSPTKATTSVRVA